MDRISRPVGPQIFKNLLAGTDYTSPKIFGEEFELIFNKSWLFAGMRTSLRKHNDYLLLNFFDQSIVVGNFGGRIKAFENRCTHRSSPIHRSECGNRALKCPFHGWTFDNEGRLNGVPHGHEFFGFDDKAKDGLRLKTFEVGMAGDFIFVKMPGAKSSLREFLGDHFESLQAMKDKWVCAPNWQSTNVACNWKLLVEVSLESYHVPEVHPMSLGAQGQPAPDKHEFLFSKRGHMVMNVGGFADAHIPGSAATGIFIFPNFYVMQIDHTIFSANLMLPLTTTTSLMRSYTFTNLHENATQADLQQYAHGLMVTNLDDKQICEGVQARIGAQPFGQPLACVEEPLLRFQENVLIRRSFMSKLKNLFSVRVTDRFTKSV